MARVVNVDMRVGKPVVFHVRRQIFDHLGVHIDPVIPLYRDFAAVEGLGEPHAATDIEKACPGEIAHAHLACHRRDHLDRGVDRGPLGSEIRASAKSQRNVEFLVGSGTGRWRNHRFEPALEFVQGLVRLLVQAVGLFEIQLERREPRERGFRIFDRPQQNIF